MGSSLDLRPRVVLHTSAGAVIILVDPERLESGNVVFPAPLGSVPYRIVYDFPVSTIILDFPVYGPVSLPVSLTAMGESGSQTVELPLLGPAQYEVVLGPPDIPPENVASTTDVVGAALTSPGVIMLALAAVLGLLLLRR